MKRLEALFNQFPKKIDKHGRPLPFWTCGEVVGDRRFTEGQRDKIREIVVQTEEPDQIPGSEFGGSYTRIRFNVKDLGDFGQKDFRGLKVFVTQYVFRWEFRGKSYCVSSESSRPKIKPIGKSRNGVRR
jgi:hypothetical protein